MFDYRLQRICLAGLAALVIAMTFIGLAQAQENPPTHISDDQVNAVARQLYCPVCENIPLDVCPTQACAQWRELIRLKLSQGWTEAQIKQYFVDQYGDRVLATPPARGLNWLVYGVPPIAILIGLFILYQAFRAWTKPQPAGATNEPAASTADKLSEDDEYIRRLEEELQRNK